MKIFRNKRTTFGGTPRFLERKLPFDLYLHKISISVARESGRANTNAIAPSRSTNEIVSFRLHGKRLSF